MTIDNEMGPDVRTVRPTASPWLDAPTHDGLWWVLGAGEGADIALLRLTQHYENVWRIAGFSFEELDVLHPDWRYAPATPPAAPASAVDPHAPTIPAPPRVDLRAVPAATFTPRFPLAPLSPKEPL